MRGRGLSWFGLGMMLPLLAGGAPLVRDLGDGLGYVRIRELPADLPVQPPGPPPPCVVDVRYVAAGPEVAVAFAAWLKFRATPRSPIFVLANGETSADLRRVLRAPHRGTGLAVIGIPGPDFEPDVAVRFRAEEERAAYVAGEKEVPLARLLADNPGKVRHDEARLTKAPRSAPEGEANPAAAPLVPVDATLQRAVHLHRSLRALRRL
jgi:hypothetical protein